jgi:hypothetical protein
MFNWLKRLFRTKSITRYLRAWISGVIPSYWTSNPETEQGPVHRRSYHRTATLAPAGPAAP